MIIVEPGLGTGGDVVAWHHVEEMTVNKRLAFVSCVKAHLFKRASVFLAIKTNARGSKTTC